MTKGGAPVEGEKAMFIRSHPEARTTEVVALAKKAGLRIGVEYVRTIRLRDRDRERKRAKRGEAPAPLSANAFVKTLSLDLPVPEVIARGEAAGITMSAASVHTARVAMRKAAQLPAPTYADGSKARFIKAQPLSMPADELIALGRAAGIALTPEWIRVTRLKMTGAAPRGRPRSESSTFVDAQPREMAASEVVERAAEAGITTTEGAVTVRRWRTDKRQSKPPSGPLVRGSKRAFVESLSIHMPTAEVMERALAAGMTIHPQYISSVRSKMRARRDESTALAVVPTAATARRTMRAPTEVRRNGARPANAPGEPDPKAVALLRAIAAEVGNANAIEILQADRDQLRLLLEKAPW